MSKRAAAPAYPIRAVARMTGLSIDTLRAWERRYEAVVPTRGVRGRVYSDADVGRLKQLGVLVGRGHAIGTVAGLPADELARLIERSDGDVDRRDAIPAADFSGLLRALDRYDLPAIEAGLGRHAAVLPTRELIFAVILPLLRALGERWEAGSLSPAQEHLISAIVRSALGGLLRTIGTGGSSPRVVFATLAGERHELCLLCAAVLSAAAGVGVLYLGADLPAADIAHAAKASGATAVVLAATAPGVAAPADVKRLARELTGVDLWIGGPHAADLVAQSGIGAAVETLDDLLLVLARDRNGSL